MKTLLLGGVKSGKSREAERLAAESGLPVTVIATANALDREMSERIEQHRTQRNKNWYVIEEPIALGHAVTQLSGDHCVIVDCLTLWLTNLLLADDETLFQQEKERFEQALQRSDSRLLIVSNETNMGVTPMGELSRRYCDEVGLLHQSVAALSDEVTLVIAGLCHPLKTRHT